MYRVQFLLNSSNFCFVYVHYSKLLFDFNIYFQFSFSSVLLIGRMKSFHLFQIVLLITSGCWVQWKHCLPLSRFITYHFLFPRFIINLKANKYFYLILIHARDAFMRNIYLGLNFVTVSSFA